VLEPVLEPAWALLKSVLLPNWGAARDAIQLNLQDAQDRRGAENKQHVARLVESLQHGEADALVTHLARAAAQATTEDRMRMLAAAAAGVLTPDLDSEMRSRVARAVEQLEPSDVIALRRVNEAFARGENVQQVEGTPQNRTTLVQFGCLNIAAGAGYRSLHEPTQLGLAVLKSLEFWPRVPPPRS
jgi:hypothetical protein